MRDRCRWMSAVASTKSVQRPSTVNVMQICIGGSGLNPSAQPFRRRRHSVGCTHVRPGWTEAASPFCYSYKLTGIAMDRVFWKRAALTPIRVLLLPTDTFSFCSYGCSLHKLANILNGALKSYKFDVPVPESKKPGSSQSRIGISLEKRRPLLNDNVRESAAKTTAERRAAVSTYITSEDAADQCLQYAENIPYRSKTEFLSKNDMVVVIGGEVIVPDVTDNGFEVTQLKTLVLAFRSSNMA
jgi:hypothetical protein